LIGCAPVIHRHAGTVMCQPPRGCLPLAGTSDDSHAFTVPIRFHDLHHHQSDTQHGGQQADQPEALYNLHF
jgi:hypothetical protein